MPATDEEIVAEAKRRADAEVIWDQVEIEKRTRHIIIRLVREGWQPDPEPDEATKLVRDWHNLIKQELDEADLVELACNIRKALARPVVPEQIMRWARANANAAGITFEKAAVATFILTLGADQ